jgi:multiple sugar transport system ATP-binding protein
MARVIFEQVTKTFGDVVAVRDLEFEVHDREFLVLVGPSGSGKSTVLRLVAGLEDLTAGSIYIGSRRVNDLAPKDRDVSMVFQTYALYPHMNVYDNIANPLRLRHVPRPEMEERVGHAANMLGLTQLLTRKPKELSGGQRQRVALARAIVRDPQVFLMDEPLSNLDVRLRASTRLELLRLHERLRATTIYVTHDQQEAMMMGDRIAVMHNGMLQQVGAPEILYNRPSTLFVAQFIGNPAINLLDGRIVGSEGGLYVEGIGFRLRLAPGTARMVGWRQDDEVVVGIRPENIFELEDVAEMPPDSTLEGRVEFVEPMGSETYVHFAVGTASLTARLRPDCHLYKNQTTTFAVDTTKFHIFDNKTQRSLTY